MDSTSSWRPPRIRGKWCKRAEALGFHRAWFYDTQLLNCEVFVAMAAAAMQNDEDPPRHGRADPLEPHRAGGRERAGRPERARARPDRLRRLDRVHGPPHDGAAPGEARGHGRVRPRRARPAGRGDARMDVRGQAPEDPLPQSRDRRREHRRPDSRFTSPRSGRARDGSPPSSAPAGSTRRPAWRTPRGAIADMQAAWREAGRDPAAMRRPPPSPGCVLRDGEAADSPRAKAHAGPTATIALHSLVERDEFGDLGRPIPRSSRRCSSDTGRSISRTSPPTPAI